MAEGEPSRSRLGRGLWFTAGLLLTALGLIGAVLPLLPSAIFLILAAACFGRSSPRMEAWIVNHPQVGPYVRDWRERGAIPLRGKLLASGGMAGSFATLMLFAKPEWPIALGVALTMALIATWIMTRPS